MVATSNRAPGRLYEGGLNRGYFLPFIGLLERHCIVHDMEGSVDYRRVLAGFGNGGGGGSDGFFFVYDRNKGVNDETTDGCCPMFEAVIGSTWDGASVVGEMTLPISFGRSLCVRRTYTFKQDNNNNNDNNIEEEDGNTKPPDMARFHFNDLCVNSDLGSSDYRAIARRFPAVAIEGVPILNRRQHDRARRFITLIDELYEAGCVLLIEAVKVPDDLFDNEALDTENEENEEKKATNNSVVTNAGDILDIDVAESNGLTVGGMASVRELSFAFRRAASRLTEMCSVPWWERRRKERKEGKDGSLVNDSIA